MVEDTRALNSWQSSMRRGRFAADKVAVDKVPQMREGFHLIRMKRMKNCPARHGDCLPNSNSEKQAV